MLVNSYNVEFGYELLSAIPYAYELSLEGKLTETISGFDTEPLYYFSPKHTINKEERNWFHTQTARENGLPYTGIHTPERPDLKFPPYKEIYANSEYKWKKPTLCICNRYNIEWGIKAINYFDIDTLDWLFANLKSKYEIVYFPVSLPKELQDSIEPLQLDDISLCHKHKVKVFTEIKSESWNESILKVFANCEHFITMNGGYSILASMFSGTNIIYSVPGETETREIGNKSFWRWYPNINNVRTLHVPSYHDLKVMVNTLYIKEQPCLNILVRTNRPNYLANCIKSIREQNYRNINLLLICDNPDSVKYTREYDARMIAVERNYEQPEHPGTESYGKWFPYNLYLDKAQRLVNGFILCLDDDDMFKSTESASRIMSYAERDKLTLWKVDMRDIIIPSHSFGISLTMCDVTGIGMCYHSDHIDKTDWAQWKRADFRTAKSLSNHLPITWVDEILTAIQDRPGMGVKRDLDNYLTIKMIRNGMVYTQCYEKAEYEGIKEILTAQGYTLELCTGQQK